MCRPLLKTGLAFAPFSESTGNGSMCYYIFLITLKLAPVSLLNCLMEIPFSLSFFRNLSRLGISNF